jgi:hypothetical protein
LNATFLSNSVELQPADPVTLTASNPSIQQTFTIDQTQSTLFTLSASSLGIDNSSSITMKIFDSLGNVISSITMGANETFAFSLILNPGNYTIEMIATNALGQMVPIEVSLNRITLSDPIGISPYNPTGTGTTSGTSPTCTIDYSFYTALKTIFPLYTIW